MHSAGRGKIKRRYVVHGYHEFFGVQNRSVKMRHKKKIKFFSQKLKRQQYLFPCRIPSRRNWYDFNLRRINACKRELAANKQSVVVIPANTKECLYQLLYINADASLRRPYHAGVNANFHIDKNFRNRAYW